MSARRTVEGGTGKSEGEGVDSESKLASDLYLKRCDGVFKNAKGEILRREG